ncbi:MAG: MerR family transcriptional regulator [Lachnospiraceae bacterium]|nr:MerR family transcriptional regulator [Agathobacter sp.]MDD6446058.1 MerR family transcriptional regulator [Lachnospiraceae bacterium]MDY4893876.1 MerR family transcriptional regulator [Agathobacter sp.]
MKIKFVEELVGITRKNIRFYEEQGLINPRRAENGYREYEEADVHRLMQVKLLRKLGVPIEEIRRVFDGKTSLCDCLEHHQDELERQKEGLTKMQTVSDQIIASRVSLENLATESYLDQIEQMEKEGMDFMDVGKKDIRKEKRLGAIIAGILMILLMLVPAAAIIWATKVEQVPIFVILVFTVVPIVLAICILVALVGRIKEIEGGEEDEASKY